MFHTKKWSKGICRPFTWTVVKHVRAKSLEAEGIGENPLRSLLQDASRFGEPETEALEPELRWATQPYTSRLASEENPAETPRWSPRSAAVLLFPGAGAQRPGMARHLLQVPAARDLYEFASTVIGWDVTHLCSEGSSAELARHAHTATLVTALAALERAREERPAALERVRATAGAGVGELGALVFADAIPLESALRLAELLDLGEEAAAAATPLAALEVRLGTAPQLPHAMLRAREHAATKGVARPACFVAQHVYPARKIVAGDELALQFLRERGKEFGVVGSRPAAPGVPRALHTPCAALAETALKEALAGVELREPRVRVISCTEARAHGDAASLARLLPRLATRAIRWEQTLAALFSRPRGSEFPMTLVLAPAADARLALRRVNARAWDCSLAVDESEKTTLDS